MWSCQSLRWTLDTNGHGAYLGMGLIFWEPYVEPSLSSRGEGGRILSEAVPTVLTPGPPPLSTA